MLAVGCGSTALESACRALMAATCAGVACFGLVGGVSPQKPRELMISAGVLNFGSVRATASGLAGAGAGTMLSAEAT